MIEKVVEQLLKDPNTKIQEFVVAFKTLRKDLDTGTLQQNTLITSRISDQVDILGTYMQFYRNLYTSNRHHSSIRASQTIHYERCSTYPVSTRYTDEGPGRNHQVDCVI